MFDIWHFCRFQLLDGRLIDCQWRGSLGFPMSLLQMSTRSWRWICRTESKMLMAVWAEKLPLWEMNWIIFANNFLFFFHVKFTSCQWKVWISSCFPCKCQQEVEDGFLELKLLMAFAQKNCPYGKWAGLFLTGDCLPYWLAIMRNCEMIKPIKHHTAFL